MDCSKFKEEVGFNGIPYELYKLMTAEWEHYVLNLFNKTYTHEKFQKLCQETD